MSNHKDRSRYVYIVTSAYDYEGSSLPWLITEDREEAITMIRTSPPPGPVETYEVHRYPVGEEHPDSEQIASRGHRQKVWVRDDATK